MFTLCGVVQFWIKKRHHIVQPLFGRITRLRPRSARGYVATGFWQRHFFQQVYRRCHFEQNLVEHLVEHLVGKYVSSKRGGRQIP